MQALVERILTVSREKKWRLALAESCTGGLISSRITSVSGVSEFFLGSVVSYANEVKIGMLDVPAPIIKSVGAVSAEVAIAMAKGVQKHMNSDWSLAVTGIAGPSGGSPEKPVGTVWFGICGPGFERTEKQLFKGTRQEIQERAAVHALRVLVEAMEAQG
ncbi:MAG TPA: CinA family protein [Bdellovibrionales bacterium]|nr:CinA family protein [Bdellovibrionales bacterium]